jgi:ethanolamine transporter EutH
MKRVVLFFLFGCLSVIAFASFPVETQALIADVDPESFKLDTLGFIIGIVTMPLLLFYGLPCALLFINKKNFRKSLVLGWLAGLVLITLIVIAVETEIRFLY